MTSDSARPAPQARIVDPSALRQWAARVLESEGMSAANAEQVADADLVITGEGRIDSQTIHGKVPVGVARVAKRYNKPVIGIAGSLTADVGVVHEHGIDAVFSVLYTICSLEDALDNASENVQLAARNIAAVLKVGQGLKR